MWNDFFEKTKERMAKSVEAVSHELSSIRTGKASIHLLDNVKVEAYGTVMPLNQLATITAPEPRLVMIQAFDKSTVGDIIKGIQKGDLGLNPTADGAVVRIPVPALNEERRKELVKQCKHLAEEGRIAIRNIRRDANENAKNLQKEKNISEDQEADAHDEVQKATDDFIKQIDKMVENKETDVMEV